MTAKPQPGYRLPLDVVEWVRQRAFDRRVTKSTIVEDALREAMHSPDVGDGDPATAEARHDTDPAKPRGHRG